MMGPLNLQKFGSDNFKGDNDFLWDYYKFFKASNYNLIGSLIFIS